MADENYDSVIKVSRMELMQLIKSSKEKWKLGTYSKFDFDQDEGKLVFYGNGKPRVICEIQVIGSYSTKSGTWLWAWDNPSLNDSLKADSLTVRDFGLKNGVEGLATPTWSGTENDCWDMTAIAAHVVSAEGAYRAPMGDVMVFMLLKRITPYDAAW